MNTCTVNAAPILKAGTPVRTRGFPAGSHFPAVPPERAMVCRWNRSINGEPMPGWYLVRFASDGKQLVMHETNLERVL